MNHLTAVLPLEICSEWRGQVEMLESFSLPITQLPLDADKVLDAVVRSAAAQPLVEALGEAPWCNLSQSWLRSGHPPHFWHQDGALRHDFLAHDGFPAPDDAALEMRTLWIALTPCGIDAPSLQWVDVTLPTLLPPRDLVDHAVASRFGIAALRHAVLQPGDALLFDGLCLHRTHLLPTMAQPRVSLELRFFRAAALPARVAADTGKCLPRSVRVGAVPVEACNQKFDLGSGPRARRRMRRRGDRQ